jgi:hypothetical protein
MCFDFLYNFCQNHFSLEEEFSEILSSMYMYMYYIDVHVQQCSNPLLLSDFIEIWIFSTDFRKILKHKISWKSVEWEPSGSMRADGRTDEAKALFTGMRTRLKIGNYLFLPK